MESVETSETIQAIFRSSIWPPFRSLANRGMMGVAAMPEARISSATMAYADARRHGFVQCRLILLADRAGQQRTNRPAQPEFQQTEIPLRPRSRP